MSRTYRKTANTIDGARGIARDGQQLRSIRRPNTTTRRTGTRAAVVAAELAEHYADVEVSA